MRHKEKEIGEEVIVGFENGNAEKPFVLGAMFHGTGKSGHGGAGNYIKGIETATGIKIKMNDQDKSVLVEDPSGNTWFMDGKGNINVNAPNDITMTAGGNISLSAGQNINTNATLNISETAGVDKSTSVGMLHNLFVGGDSMVNVSGKLVENITGNVESHTEKERVENAKGGISNVSEGSINKHAKKEVQNNSGEKSKLF
jgi:type VI secretion system secreted protein VgrG